MSAATPRVPAVDVLDPYEKLSRRNGWTLVSPFGSRWLGGSLNESRLRLWTVQSEAAYRELAETGVLCADSRYAEEDFEPAYRWMQEQAAARLTTNGGGILWLWARRHRRFEFEAKYDKGDVLLEVAVPFERVLLSDFDEWHSVLNTSFAVGPAPGETADQWWARAEPLMDDFDDRLRACGVSPGGMQDVGSWPEDLRAEIEESWECIFDHEVWSRTGAHVQAVVHELRAMDVVRAVRISRLPF